MNLNNNILRTFTDPLIWCESYLRDPRDREKKLILRSYQKEVLENSRQYKNMILQWGRRMGKCSYINDLAQLSDGRRLTFGELLDMYNRGESIELLSLDENYNQKPTSNVIILDNGIKEVYEIKTRSGKQLHLTKNHPLLTISGWKPLIDIKVGDTVCVPSKININSVKNELLNLVNSDVYWDEIVSIKSIGDKQTVEVQADPYHNYIQNDVLVHNSVVMCSDCLWWACIYPYVRMIENKDDQQKPFRIIVCAPYESQIRELWKTFAQLIGDSPLLKDMIAKITSSDMCIHFKGHADQPGSIISGHTVGVTSANQGTSLRGLSADMIFIDEMDFIPPEIIEQVILPISSTHDDVKMRICSTPSGKRELYYKFCVNAQKAGWFHTHYPSWHEDNDNWLSIEDAIKQGRPVTDSSEFQFKQVTTSDAYAREYGAEFGEEFGGVYKHSLLERAMHKYGRNINLNDPDIFDPGFKQNPQHKYVMGVDWNSYINGGQVVIVEYCSTPTFVSFFHDEENEDVSVDFTGKYRLFYRRGVKSKEATQRMTREEIIRLMKKWKIDYLYVDYGAGDTNIEELSLYGRDHPELELNKKLRVVDSGSTVEHYDHVLQKPVKKRVKSLMVNFSVLSLEEGMFLLPREEDTQTRLVGQMRSYVIKNVTSRGDYTYEGVDHILDAFNLAIYGFQQNYGQLLQSRINYNINVLNDPRAGLYPSRTTIEKVNSPIAKYHSNSFGMSNRDPDKPPARQVPHRVWNPQIGSRTKFNKGIFGRGNF